MRKSNEDLVDDLSRQLDSLSNPEAVRNSGAYKARLILARSLKSYGGTYAEIADRIAVGATVNIDDGFWNSCPEKCEALVMQFADLVKTMVDTVREDFPGMTDDDLVTFAKGVDLSLG